MNLIELCQLLAPYAIGMGLLLGLLMVTVPEVPSGQ